MSGWQRLSCLVLFSSLTVCSLTPGTGDEGNMQFSDYLPLVPARSLLSLQGDQTQHHSPASSFSPLLVPSQIWGLPPQHTGNTHVLTNNKLMCSPLLASFYFVLLCFLVGLNHDTDLLQLKCLHFTNSLIWLEKTFWKKRKSRQFEQIWDSSLLFPKETGKWWHNTTTELACGEEGKQASSLPLEMLR